MTVTTIVSANGFSAEVTGSGYNPRGDVIIDRCDNMKLAKESIYSLLEVGCVCNNASITDENLRGQPTEGALLAAALKFEMHGVRQQYLRLHEYPFSSEQKIMAVKVKPASSSSEEDDIFFVKGAPEKVISHAVFYKQHGKADLAPLTPEAEMELNQAAQKLSRKGLRGKLIFLR